MYEIEHKKYRNKHAAGKAATYALSYTVESFVAL